MSNGKQIEINHLVLTIQEDTLRAQTSRQLKTARIRTEKHPTPDIVTPPEPDGEALAEILQMAEDSARRNVDKVAAANGEGNSCCF